MRKTIAYILDFTSKLKTEEERIACLRANPVVKTVLKHMFDPNDKFDLPDGDPPYTEFNGDEPGRLYSELRRLYLFTAHGNPNLKPLRREMLFIDLLQSVNADEAKLLLAIKNQKSPWKKIDAKLAKAAFPDIL